MFLQADLFESVLLDLPKTVKKIGKNSFTIIKESKQYLKLKIENDDSIYYVDIFPGGCRLGTDKRDLIEKELDFFFELENLGILKIKLENVRNKKKLYELLLLNNNFLKLNNYKERIYSLIEDVTDVFDDENLQKLLTLIDE